MLLLFEVYKQALHHRQKVLLVPCWRKWLLCIVHTDIIFMLLFTDYTCICICYNCDIICICIWKKMELDRGSNERMNFPISSQGMFPWHCRTVSISCSYNRIFFIPAVNIIIGNKHTFNNEFSKICLYKTFL